MPKISEAGKDAWAETARTGASASACSASYKFKSIVSQLSHATLDPEEDKGGHKTYSSEAGTGEGLKREQSQREETEASHLERYQKRNKEVKEDGLEGEYWLHVCKTPGARGS
jgi:hypothetical protein